MIDLGNINIIVGRNNAGKSTVLKALQLIKGNLNTLSNISNAKSIFASMKPMFIFDVDEMAELHIDNFERALYNKASRKEITLSANLDGFLFTIVLDGQNIKQNNYYVAVPYNFIELKNSNVHITFNFQTRDLHLEMKAISNKENEEKIAKLSQDRNNYLTTLDNIKNELREIAPMFHAESGSSLSTSEMVEMISKRQKLEQMQKSYQKQLDATESEIATIESTTLKPISVDIKNLPEFSDTVKVNVIGQIFHNISNYVHMQLNMDKRTSEYKEAYEVQEKLKNVHDDLMTEGKKFLCVLADFEMEYIHAHAASQKVIYLKEDRNDTLSRVLSGFCKARIVPGSKEWTFVKKWMKEFEIGADFRILDVESAGYMLKIFDEGEDPECEFGGYTPTVLIEEPEQNIHPMLQSMLADMFLDFWNQDDWYNYDCQLIIETHSEYLVRRTQLLVAEKNYKTYQEVNENNPFKVFYFPSEKGKYPYDMQYMPNGMFANKFDSGFFDEAGHMHMEILKKSKKG